MQNPSGFCFSFADAILRIQHKNRRLRRQKGRNYLFCSAVKCFEGLFPGLSPCFFGNQHSAVGKTAKQIRFAQAGCTPVDIVIPDRECGALYTVFTCG